MGNDPIINPGGGAPPADPPESKRKRIRCDFCECELASDGGVLRTSEKAKLLEKADREIKDLQGRLETAQHDLEELRAPKPDPVPEQHNGPAPVIRPARSAFSY